MNKIRLRLVHEVDFSRMFSATLRGGVRGYADCVAVDTFSNDMTPTIRTLSGFVVIVIPDEEIPDSGKPWEEPR